MVDIHKELDELFVKIGSVRDGLDDLTNAVIEIKKKLFDEKHEEEISKETKQEG